MQSYKNILFSCVLACASALSAHAATWTPSLDVTTDKACYAPGQTVTFKAVGTMPAYTNIRYRHGSAVVETARLTSSSWTWRPPTADYQGYMAELFTTAADGTETIVGTIAVDVSSQWTRFPRYGFVADFDNYNNTVDKNANIKTEMAYLNRLHINGVQFQDWQWMHHKPVKFNADGSLTQWYQDISNRWVGVEYVKNYIAEQHKYGMKSIFYDLCFGAWKDADKDGVKPEWALLKKDAAGRFSQDYHGLPSSWASNIYLQNPGNEGWISYMKDRCDEVYKKFGFDGFQVDQLGNRGEVFDCNHKKVELDKAYEPFLAAMKTAYPEKTLVMNAVSGFGTDYIVKANVDFCYNEVWGNGNGYGGAPEQNFANLYDIIKENDKCSNQQRSTVFAAYINYDKAGNDNRPDTKVNTPGVLLADAVMFALGGSHLEIGDHMLTREYFPAAPLQMDAELKQRLVHYYDFLTAYQNLLRGTSLDQSELKAEVSTSASDVAITAWPPKAHTMTTFAKRIEDKDVVHFLNFTNTDDLSWRDVNGTRPAPTLKTDIPVTVKVARPVGKLWVASPDIDGGAVKELSFSQNGSDLSFVLPSVEYWTMAVVEYKNVEDNIFITGDGVQKNESIAWSIKDGIQMIKGDNDVFTATAYITKGKPFKFVTVSTKTIKSNNNFSWDVCKSYNAEYENFEFKQGYNTANVLFCGSDDYKYTVSEDANYDITLDLAHMTIKVDKSAYQDTPVDRFPALYVVGAEGNWNLSQATPLVPTDLSKPYVITAQLPIKKDNDFKFATRTIDEYWDQTMFGMGASADKMTVLNSETGDRKWVAPNDGYYFVTVNKLTNEVSIESQTTVNVGASGYATYCCDKPINWASVSGLDAYVAVATKTDGSTSNGGSASANGATTKVTMKPLDLSSPGTGLLLHGAQGSYVLPFCKDNGAHVDNLLRGVLTATDIKSEADGFTHYILAKGKEGIGFYPTKDGTIAANKAYLALPSDMAGAKAVMIDLGNATTSIAYSAANSPTSNSCYNLAGIRIPASTKGLHVEKGKKVVVR